MNDKATQPEKIEPPPTDPLEPIARLLALDAEYHTTCDGMGVIRIPAPSHSEAMEMLRAARTALIDTRAASNGSYRAGFALVVSEVRAIPGIGNGPMLSELPGVVRARIEALEDDLARHRSERSYIVGCVDGFDAAMEQMTEVLLTARRLVQATIHEEVTEAADWETLADDIDAALAAAPERVRHVKRGSTYRVVGRGKIQTDTPLTDYAEVVVYRGEEDGLIWVRPTAEFDDGRFVATKPEGRADG